jgi:hypothetical protein
MTTRQPNKGQWKKGQSGNPKGRAKLGETLAEKFRDAMAEKVNGDYSKLDKLIDKTIDMALKGNQNAIEFALARGWGKLIDRVESVNTNLNTNYDITQLPLEERRKLLETLKSVRKSDST